MTEALAKAHADLQFQAILAQLFGVQQTIKRNFKELTGYEWRGKFFVFKVAELPGIEPATPKPDSHQ